MVDYDITQRVAPFLDVHLVIPLLEFLAPRKVYDEVSLFETHRKLLLKTKMIDSIIETYAENQIPIELLEKRDEILEERENLKAKCDPVVEILERKEIKEMMENARDREGNSKILEYIEQKSGFKLEMLDYLYKYAKLLYECGNYSAASICLYYYRNVVPQQDPNYLNALYGKLASEILNQEDVRHAKDDLTKLRAYIDSDPFDTELELLQHRAWLMHLALFVYFNSSGQDEIIEMFLSQPYLNTIQILCPHLLRYLSVAVVTSKAKRKSTLKELINVIDVERHNYRDTVIDFLCCLYIDFNFDEAQEKLRECESVLSNDFFLTNCLSDFRDHARHLIFEMFCRIHQCISLEMLASRLNMDIKEAERWIVDLICDYHIDFAKIDHQQSQVMMGVKPVSIHEQVMENTKRLTLRSQQLSVQLEKLKNEKKTYNGTTAQAAVIKKA